MKVKIKGILVLISFFIGGFSYGQNNNCVYIASDVYPGSFGSLPSAITVYNGALYFSATGNAQGAELWKFENGVASMVADINPGFLGSMPNEFTVLGPHLYFSANNGVTGVELFRYDGTSVTLVADICPGAGGSFISKLTVIGSDLFFMATDGITGMEPYKYDGTTVQMIADINPGSGGSFPWQFNGFNGSVFFAATSPTHGLELWEYDGISTNVFDLYPGPTGSDLGEMTVCGGKLIFRATDGVLGYELWTYDGTTLVNLDANPAGDLTPWELTVVGSDLFFRGFNSINGYELWKYDGVTAAMVMDIFPGTGNSHPNNMIAVGGTDLFFAANNGVVGNELWHYDGTTASLVADILPGPSASMIIGGEKMATVGSDIFFVATNGTSGYELWRSDGTQIELSKDIVPGTGSPAPSGMKGFGSQMFFMADDGIVGGELWVWDPNVELDDSISIVVCGDYTSPAGNFFSAAGVYDFIDTIPSVNCPACDSILTINLTLIQQDTAITVFACNNYTSPSGSFYNIQGNYLFVDVIPSVACIGADSTITIDLTILENINTATAVLSGVIVALQPGANYQWLNCDAGNAPIPGATSQDFLPTVNGNYACEITLGSCVDTTNCSFVVADGGGIGISEESHNNILIYPNPVSDLLFVSTEGTSSISVQIFDNLGQVVATEQTTATKLSVDTRSMSNGIYFIYVQTDKGSSIQKFVKQ